MLRTSMKMAAAALAAGALLSACGQVKMGAAAVMTSQRISTSTLSAEVSNLNQGYQRYKGKVALQYPVSQMPQQVLSWLVRFRVRDQLAEEKGIRVTPAQVQSAFALIKSQAQSATPGQPVSLPELAVANGLPPNLLDELGNYQAVEIAYAEKANGGKLPTATASVNAITKQFNTAECHVYKSDAVKVSPQFGQFNFTQSSVVAAPDTLSAAGGAAPKNSTSGTTPSC